LKRAAILQAARDKKLKTGDQIANSKDGPWQDVTKDQIQQMRQGSDVEIKRSATCGVGESLERTRKRAVNAQCYDRSTAPRVPS
jgi:hypothetical protein